MSQLGDELAFVPEKFSGRARLFPLPNLVLFPGVVQPLHIFEPRYVDLLHDALQDDRLIAMSLLKSGWENDYEGRPPIAPVACLGRVLTWQAQAGHRYNVLLLGVRRVRVDHELAPDRSFRLAEATILNDEYPAAGTERRRTLHRELIDEFERMLPRLPDAEDLFNQLSLDSISLGTLTDVISYALDLNLSAKQRLLSEPNVDRRVEWLLAHLRAASHETHQCSLAGDFPPSFSAN